MITLWFFIMATYKVIQDIEAEDKFLGPLTLKQFIFGAIGIFFGYLSFFAVVRGFPVALVIFAPPMILGLFLAIPWSKEQSTEVWVLAKLRFRLMPKKRIWDQSGMEELVTITAPKKEEKMLTDGLDQTEVKSRLKALAETIDSRGWAVKHAEMGASAPVLTSDRLVNASSLPQAVPIIDLNTVPDVMDGTSSTGLEIMLQQSTDMRKQQNLEKLDRIRHGEPLEAIRQPALRFTPPPIAQSDDLLIDEDELTEKLKAQKTNTATNRMHTIQPTNPYAVDLDPNYTDENKQQDNQAQASMPTATTPAILDYASNDDLDVATIARQAQKDSQKDSGEVVISLR